MGVGQLTVLVPEDVIAGVVADAGLGAVALTDLDGDRQVLSEGGSDGQRDAHEELVVGGPSGDATVEVGMGEVEMRRVEAVLIAVGAAGLLSSLRQPGRADSEEDDLLW